MKKLLVATLIIFVAPACSNPSAIPNLTISQAVTAHQKEVKDKRAEEDETAESETAASDQEVTNEPEVPEAPAAADMSVSQATSAGGDLWRWQLDADESYQLQYKGVTDLTMTIGGQMGGMMQGMMGGGGGDVGGEMEDRITMHSELTLNVERILPDGRFDLRIVVERLVIESTSGEHITLSNFPEEIRVLRAFMTPRGTMEFYERIMIEVRDEEVYGVARMSNDGTSQEITLGGGGMEVTSRADINPRTGAVSLNQEVRRQEPNTRKVEQEQPVQYIDVLPVDLLSMMELPERPVAAGDSLEFDSIAGNMKVDAGDPVQCSENQCGELRYRLDVDSASMNQAAASAHQADDGFDDGFYDHMVGMEPGEAMAMQPTMKAEVDATMLFDVPRGRLFRIEGTSGSVSGSAGVEMRESTEFTLIFLE